MKLTSMQRLAATTCLASGLCLAGLFSLPARAFTPYTIYDANGNAAFEMRLFVPQDGSIVGDPDGRYTPTWTIDAATRDRVLSAAQYWADIINVVPGNNPAIITVGTEDDINASANSPNASDETGAGTLVHAALNNIHINADDDEDGDDDDIWHGFIIVGRMDWDYNQPFVPSQLILTPKVDMSITLIHEMAHALGLAANVSSKQEQGQPIEISFKDSINAWTSHLIDDDGKLAQPGQIITCNFCAVTEGDDTTFNVANGFAYFSGKNVTEVLNGALPGVPVRIDTSIVAGVLDQPFSHSEFRNSLMSHQNYNNRSTLMEAEFAALQDLGYQLDRRNLFGFSIYNDDTTLINDHPFFARNEEGTAYIANSYNMATMGLGLDVYGSNITISQRADLLSAGAGGGGIRVDGFDNAVTILPGTKVHANGSNGLGVVFAYGKGNSLTQRGDVEALGQNGIAVAIDFGHNSNGDRAEYRGSYFVRSNQYDFTNPVFAPYYEAALAEVSGPLVETFDLTGRVAGSKAAIFASESGYVGSINVMQGAEIRGNIISSYAQKDDNGDLRLTELSFGLKPDGNGHALAAADSSFRFSYGDDIIGKNLSVQFYGGTSTLTGQHDIHEVIIENGATLAGSGSYTINANRAFNNDGILNPSIVDNDIAIDGNYVQSETGTLQLAFNDQKQISSLIVSEQATLDGTLSFAPTRGYYGNGFSLTSDKWLQAYDIAGKFAKVGTTLTSPTLTASAIDNGDTSYTVSLSRATNAYAQYGATANGRSVGATLDQSAGNAAPALQPLIAALDFSAADGSTIRSALPQLSGEAHASATGVLANASGATRSSVNSRLQQAFGSTPAAPVAVLAFGPDKQTTASTAAIDQVAPAAISNDDLARYAAWGSVFGSWSAQSGDGNAARTKSTLGGFTSGIDAGIADDWRLGLMAGYSRSTFRTSGRSSSGSSDNYTIGAYAGTEWGNLGFRSGLAYSWHNIAMNRSVAFDGFADSLSADYNAGTFQAFGELGYKIKASERSIFEPYANLAYVHVRTDAFTEQGNNGAALAVQSNGTDLGLSTLGIRASTSFDLGTTMATARADLGWRHAFGDVIPTSTASFAAGSNAFTASGNAIGKNTPLIEAGLDFAITRNTTLGVAYQGQFGSGLSQNGVNANLSVKF